MTHVRLLRIDDDVIGMALNAGDYFTLRIDPTLSTEDAIMRVNEDVRAAFPQTDISWAQTEVIKALDDVPREGAFRWPSSGNWLRILHAWIRTLVMQRQTPDSWGRWASTKRNARAIDRDDVIALVSQFRAAATILPGLSLCLPRSIAMMSFLRSCGLGCRWRFGVRTYPFEAHCWVEWEDIVLTDDASHVRWFAPILTV